MGSFEKKIYTRLRNILMRFPEPMIRMYEIIEQRNIKNKHYSSYGNPFVNEGNLVISVINDFVNPGGLTDRIFGIISTYYVCKLCGRDFKIYHDKPFDLTKFLLPSKVDWKIEREDIKFDNTSRPIFIRAISPPKTEKRYKCLRHIIDTSCNGQLHVYSNLKIFPKEQFALLFNELFVPSEILKSTIKSHQDKINGEYSSMTFRFQKLLGDFDEGDYQVLDKPKRESLLARCLDVVKSRIANSDKKILVTSDSQTFLEQVSTLDQIYVIPGKVAHMAYTSDPSLELHLKSFTDLFMIANANKIYSVIVGPMYDSGFPKMASMIYNKPFEKIIEELPL